MSPFNIFKEKDFPKVPDSINVSALLSDDEMNSQLAKRIKDNRWDQILITGREAHRMFITDNTLPLETRREVRHEGQVLK